MNKLIKFLVSAVISFICMLLFFQLLQSFWWHNGGREYLCPEVDQSNSEDTMLFRGGFVDAYVECKYDRLQDWVAVFSWPIFFILIYKILQRSKKNNVK